MLAPPRFGDGSRRRNCRSCLLLGVVKNASAYLERQDDVESEGERLRVLKPEIGYTYQELEKMLERCLRALSGKKGLSSQTPLSSQVTVELIASIVAANNIKLHADLIRLGLVRPNEEMERHLKDMLDEIAERDEPT